MMHPAQRAAFNAALKTLRTHCAEFARGFRTYAAIAAYLNEIGVRTGRGHPVTGRTVRGWRQKRGLPITTIGKRNGAWTSNLLLLAWLSSYVEYQRTKPRYSTKRQRDARNQPPRGRFMTRNMPGDGWEKADA